MITCFTSTCHPDHTVLAFNRHAMLAVIQIQHFTLTKKQFESWGF
jgi:hypothetical protein